MKFSEEFLKYLLEKGYQEGYAKHMACWVEKRVAEKRERRYESCESNEKKKRTLRRTPEDMLSNIPDDVLGNILRRLPTKSLAHFKLVCRRWRSLISDPQFARLHLNHHRGHPVSPVWIFCSGALPFQYVDTSDLSSLSIRPLYLPFKTDSIPIRVFNSCDGIICLRIPRLGLILWNPCTNKYDRMPIPDTFEGTFENCGFGYDTCNRVYKCVCQCVRVLSDGRPVCRAVEVVTVNLSSSSSTTTTDSNKPIWRRVYDQFPMTFSGAAVPFDGVLYWIAFNSEAMTKNALIQRFDLTEERFQEVPLPFKKPSKFSSFNLGVLGTHLAAFRGEAPRGRLSTDIWIMNKAATPTDTTWIKAYRIPEIPPYCLECIITKNGKRSPQTIRYRPENCYLTQEGEFVIYGDAVTQNVCIRYNPLTNDFKIDYKAPLPVGAPFLHVPSLISPRLAAEH